jgi:hypothetical protein
MNPGANTMTTHTALTTADLELAYDALAESLDAAGPDKSELFLVKLALLLANQAGNRPQFEQHIATALRDL